MDSAPSATNTQQKLTIGKFASRKVTCLKLAGWIDEDFSGKQLAATINTPTLVLHLGDVRRISSFGIREWVDFITAASKTSKHILLIECAPKIVDQANMVGNFVGPGQIFSFYAPYRCDYCDSESRVLFQIDRDWDAIKALKPPDRQCATCGDVEYFDEDPVTFLSFIAGQGRFELDPDVATFLSSQLNRPVSDTAQRLRVDKVIEDRFTLLRLSGDLDATFPRIKLAEGLEGMLLVDLTQLGRIDPAGAAEWRGFIQIITMTTQAVYLLGVPPAFVEKLTSRDDLGPKAQVVSLQIPYACQACATTAPQRIDVAQHYDLLKFATPPDVKCSDCKGATQCAASESLLSHLTTLPKPAVTPQLRKFIKTLKDRKPSERAQSSTAAQSAQAAPSGRKGSAALVLAAAVFAAVLTAGGLIGYRYLQDRDTGGTIDGIGKQVEASAPEQPAWLTSKTPFSSYCNTGSDMELSCVGVSSYVASEADAREQAQEAALEAVSHAVALRIDHQSWQANVAPIFTDNRQAKVASFFDKAETQRDTVHYDRAHRDVREGRKAVAKALRRTGGTLVPSAPSARYWERYKASPGPGSRYLVVVQYQLPADAVAALIERYSQPVTAAGTEVMTVFPGVAWRYPDIPEGAVITGQSDGPMKAMGVAEKYIVLSVQDRQIKDAASFARIVGEELSQLGEAGGELRVRIKTGDNLPLEFTRPIPRSDKPGSGGTQTDKPAGSSGKATPRGPVNTWDAVGGGNRASGP